MSKYEEQLLLKLPKGALAALKEIADRRYMAPGTMVRAVVMDWIESERRRNKEKVAA
jgi:hypothetical protein